MNKAILISIVILTFHSSFCLAQNDREKESNNEASEIAKELANPNATLGFLSVPIDYTNYKGNLPDANYQNAFRINFQPSLPYPIAEGVNLFLRPLIPIFMSQPVYNGESFENKGVDLGDIAFDLAVGKTWKSKWVTIGGVFGSAPTATDADLGTGRWSLGPEVFVGRPTGWGFLGLLISQNWSITNNEHGSSSVTSGQYFYTIQLKNAWQIKAQPTYSINHNAAAGNKWTIPIGTGIFNTWLLGKMPFQAGIQYWYYVASPETFGPKHHIRLQITPVIPLPW